MELTSHDEDYMLEFYLEQKRERDEERFLQWFKYNKQDLIKEFLITYEINSEEFIEDDMFDTFCREAWRQDGKYE